MCFYYAYTFLCTFILKIIWYNYSAGSIDLSAFPITDCAEAEEVKGFWFSMCSKRMLGKKDYHYLQREHSKQKQSKKFKRRINSSMTHLIHAAIERLGGYIDILTGVSDMAQYGHHAGILRQIFGVLALYVHGTGAFLVTTDGQVGGRDQVL